MLRISVYHKICLCLLAAIWVYGTAHAQVSYKNFNTEHGLPSSQVYDILQDTKGYMWFATDRGLCRYDGYEFTTFTTQDGLQDNVVFQIVQDKKGWLWFTSLNGGLCYYDHEKIYPHPANEDIKRISAKNYIHTLYIDEKDTVWFTLTAGKHKLYKIGPDNKIIQLDTRENTGDFNFFIRRIDGSSFIHGNIFFSENAPSRPRFRKENSIIYVEVNGLSFFAKHEFIPLNDGTYLASFDTYLVHLSDTGIIRYWYRPEYNVQDISVDATKNIWLSTVKGIIKYPNGNLDAPPEYFFGDKSVTKVYQDSEGGYWVSTLEDGVYYISSFDIWVINKENGFPDEKITAIAKGEREIWFGTFSGNLYRISGNGKFANVPYPNAREFSDMIYTADGALLLSNSARLKDGRFSTFDHNAINLKSFFQPDKDEMIFAGGGITKWKENRLVLNLRDSGFQEQVTAVYQDKAGKIWIGTHLGLYVFFNNKITYLGNENPLYKNRISDIKASAAGQLYISTIGAGILVRTGKSLTQISVKAGLSSDLVEEILIDGDHNLWSATFKGLNRITFSRDNPGKPDRIENFTTADGLPTNEIVELCLAGDTIWVGTSRGIAYFSLAGIRKTTSPPPIYITSVKINNSDTALRDSYHLSYNQRNLRIYFIGISYKSQGKVMYRYQLRGSGDSAWKYTNDRSIQYINLAAGNYTFLLSARNESGIWSAKPAQLLIRVDPHFTETWWFSLLIVIGVLSAGSSGVVIYIRGQRKKHDFEMKIARSEQKALLAQMNPHFLFNALNSILHFIIENEKRTAISYLTKFSTLIRRILEGSHKNQVRLEEELSAIQLYLELEKLRFGDRFDYTITVDEAINQALVKIPSMLIQPLVENALWHGLMPKSDNGRLQVRFTLTADNVVACTIEDNGIGRKKSMEINTLRKGHKSTGLQNIHERIHLLNQLYKHTIMIEILDLMDNDNNAAGTRVTLMLPQ